MNRKYLDAKIWSMLLFAFAGMSYFFPEWNGLLFDASSVSQGESKILMAVYFVGGLLLWYMPQKSNER